MKKATRKQLEDIAEMWYKRGQKLSVIANNPHENILRRSKAFELTKILSVRIMRITALSMPKPKNFKSGGQIVRLNNKPGSNLDRFKDVILKK
jgi:hypothetical protein